MSYQIEINGSMVEAFEGETLLTAVRRCGIKIPTLCHMNEFSPTGACRLCVVEVEGKRDLITSCSYPVEDGIVVKTNTPRVIKARKALVEMLLSNHPDDCLYCERNGNCELQWLAAELNIKERRYFGLKRFFHPDLSSTSVMRDPAKCVLCSRCVRVCEEVQLVTAIDFISRGNNTKVNSAFHKGLNVSSCINCGQCILVCPTNALTDISHIERVQAALHKPDKQTIAMVSPSVVVSLAEQWGLKPGEKVKERLCAALKKIGFQRVYDLGTACDLNIMLEAQLLAEHIKKSSALPFISSCCPSWTRYMEEFRPQSLAQLSGAKSPQQLMGTLVKSFIAQQQEQKPEDIYAVSIMPCVAKKFEAAREEMTHKGISEVDAVLTIREIQRMLRSYGIDLRKLDPLPLDEPFHQASAAAFQMTYSGGKAEAIAYQLNKLLGGKQSAEIKYAVPKNPGSRKEVKIKMGKYEVGFAWVSGIAEAEEILSEIQKQNRKDIHYIEVMGCPGGCANGGGQPISRDPEVVRSRKKTAQDLERSCKMDYPELNPLAKQLWDNLADPSMLETLKTGYHQRNANE